MVCKYFSREQRDVINWNLFSRAIHSEYFDESRPPLYTLVKKILVSNTILHVTSDVIK